MAALLRSMSRLSAVREPGIRGNNVIINCKRYVRGLRRRPVTGLNTENEVEKPSRSNQRTEQTTTSSGKNGTNHSMKTVTRTEVKEKVFQKHLNNFEFEPAGLSGAKRLTKDFKMESRHNFPSSSGLNEVDALQFDRAVAGDKRLARLVNVARSRKLREQQGKVLVEGKRLICDALAAGALPQTVFFSTVEKLRELPLDKLRRASLVMVKFQDIRSWSDLDTPQEVIAIFSRPEASLLVFAKERCGQAVPLTVICDNIRDPGNLGTTLRCAAAAGCHSVLLTKGCVDVWEPKVLRAAMGAHFRLPIIPNLAWADIPSHLPAMATIHVADSCSATTKEEEYEDKVATPHPLKKAGDYGWVRSHPELRKAHYDNDFYDDENENSDYDEESELSRPVVDTQLYHSNWAHGHTGLVIGGETHGLSLEALRLAERTGGRRLLVPMVQGVDSLNSGMAASVLVFEGRRQLMLLTEQTKKKAESTIQ